MLINIYKTNPFHIVKNSPYALLVSINLLVITISVAGLFSNILYSGDILMISTILLVMSIYNWVTEVSVEANYLGNHTGAVQSGLVIGFVLFIISELMAFFSVLWAVLHSALSPTIFIFNSFPPLNIEPINPYDIALIGSLLLLSSSISITASHYAYISNVLNTSVIYLILTIIKGAAFASLQYIEYSINIVTWDNLYGVLFYSTTGLHGAHIIIGVIFLIFSFISIINYRPTNSNHLYFKLSIIYWHFVDIIWVFVYSILYLLI